MLQSPNSTRAVVYPRNLIPRSKRYEEVGDKLRRYDEEATRKLVVEFGFVCRAKNGG